VVTHIRDLVGKEVVCKREYLRVKKLHYISLRLNELCKHSDVDDVKICVMNKHFHNDGKNLIKNFV
jgi:hypothetical protein